MWEEEKNGWQCLVVAKKLQSSSGSDMWGKTKKSAKYNVEYICTFSVQESLARLDQQKKYELLIEHDVRLYGQCDY